MIYESDKAVAIESIVRDITDRKKAEEDLKKYSNSLEEMVQERTRELERSHQELLKSERMAAIGWSRLRSATICVTH